ncbi:MAG: nicotinate phosphoribosyltransferase [SAR324 cluster bacterium]|nr:nicotinate phosphoribosyltransferase [SAR324 cluster bacterium]
MIYKQSTGLNTDLYQLSMAAGYLKAGIADKASFFNMYFRKTPFKGGFAICCGLELLIEQIENFAFSQSDINYLKKIKSSSGEILFEDDFLETLLNFKFKGDIWAMAEGEIVFPLEPMITVQGGLLECQILETLILNSLNYTTLVATKAARICLASGLEPVLEFGLRRAPGIDGGLSGTRACYVGGCSATSNLLAGKMFDIPVKGTHSHSWVLSFADELLAFEAYAKIFPHNLVLLIDTYDSLTGLENAIKVANKLANPKQLVGIRIDSGDLNYFSAKIRKTLDIAGFTNTKIFASNDLDEYIIENLKYQKAKIDVWAVGTKMITADGEASLGGVYKLSALQNDDGRWQGKVKISNDRTKINNPGRYQVRRFFDSDHKMIADALYNIDLKKPESWQIVGVFDSDLRKNIINHHSSRELLKPIYKSGEMIYNFPTIHQVRQNTLNNLATLDNSVKRSVNPHLYPAGLELSAHLQKAKFIAQVRDSLFANNN